MNNSFRTCGKLAADASIIALYAWLVGCSSAAVTPQARVDPDVARAQIVKLLPTGVSNPEGWSIDIFSAFEALSLAPNTENVCAAIAVTQQESTFQAHPPVPGLSGIARREIEARAARYRIPKPVLQLALQATSPNGQSYAQRLAKATTEKALSDIFEDFIGSVPLGRQLFADFNPVRTGGPMQVSIAFAEQHAAEHRYPYPVTGSIRDEVFTRRGGMYFGIAHLLQYPVDYPALLFRFADFNAGHYASRNAAYQKAVAELSKTQLALDGDLLRYAERASEPSNTELATRKLAAKLDLSDAEIRRDLELEKQAEFARTRLYSRLFALADQSAGKPVARAVLPRIRLRSGKITRNLTTEWFASRVDQRYRQCLERGRVKRPAR